MASVPGHRMTHPRPVQSSLVTMPDVPYALGSHAADLVGSSCAEVRKDLLWQAMSLLASADRAAETSSW